MSDRFSSASPSFLTRTATACALACVALACTGGASQAATPDRPAAMALVLTTTLASVTEPSADAKARHVRFITALADSQEIPAVAAATASPADAEVKTAAMTAQLQALETEMARFQRESERKRQALNALGAVKIEDDGPGIWVIVLGIGLLLSLGTLGWMLWQTRKLEQQARWAAEEA